MSDTDMSRAAIRVVEDGIRRDLAALTHRVRQMEERLAAPPCPYCGRHGAIVMDGTWRCDLCGARGPMVPGASRG